jgi:hypothetical protein
MTLRILQDALKAAADRGQGATFWLRDDDAERPTAALDAFLALAGRHRVPVTLAVIPAGTGAALAERLADAQGVTVAVHGWAHANHAGPGEKKTELGPHRPVATVLDELARGLGHLLALHGARAVPLLVPPWNRIDDGVVAGLAGSGYAALSVFGPEKAAPLPVLNTHVDLIDWRGTGRAKPVAVLAAELAAALSRKAPVGLLTHHLIHDADAQDTLERVLALTSDAASGCWADVRTLMPMLK